MGDHYCWICGAESETEEHRIKKSDIVQRFGKGPYSGDDSLVHVKSDVTRPLQGPNSQLVKYKNNLCSNCNNSFTQPFDRAYEEFIRWVMTNEPDILRRRVIDFEHIYGTEWEEKQRDLFKYFAKCFGCRLDEANCDVPSDVVALLYECNFETGLHVTFYVNEDQLLLPAEAHSLGTAELHVHKDRETMENISFRCGHNYRWLCCMYWYNESSLEPVGAPWRAKSKHLYLGWFAPLTPEDRADIIKRVAESQEDLSGTTKLN